MSSTSHSTPIRLIASSFAFALVSLILLGTSPAPAKADDPTPRPPAVDDTPPPPPAPETLEPANFRRATASVLEVARPVVATATAAAAPYVPAGDPYGFTAWLNGVRASYGLGAVGVDPSLSNWAAVNNGQQEAMGLGHHVMGPARRQNSGMGASSTVWQMWMASPAHQAALLDPSITMIGIAFGGAYWTFNAY